MKNKMKNILFNIALILTMQPSEQIKTGAFLIMSVVGAGCFISQMINNKQRREKDNNIEQIIQKSSLPDSEKMEVISNLKQLIK